MKRRNLSLLEVSIGLALTAILLTALFSSYRQIIQTNLYVQKAREEIHSRAVVQLRLREIFESIVEKEFYSDADKSTLFFTYDNGIDPDPAFCKELKGTLFFNDKGELVLLSENKGGKSREEILFEKKGTIHFFDPEAKEFLLEWKKDYLPPFLKITTDKTSFTFFLPKANRKALYT